MKSCEKVFINALALLPRPTGTQRELVHLIELIPGVTLWGMNPSIPFMNKNGASCNSIQAFHKNSSDLFIFFLGGGGGGVCHSVNLLVLDKLEGALRGRPAVSGESICPVYPSEESREPMFKDGSHNTGETGSVSLPVHHLHDGIVTSGEAL